VLAPRELPPDFVRWNDAHKLGPALGLTGIVLRRSGATRLLARSPAAVRACGPFVWQPNSRTRLFEYPWAYHEIAALGGPRTVVEVGGALSGMQWVLAGAGHRVVNLDPGLDTAGVAMHERLSRAFSAPVDHRTTTIGKAGLESGLADVVLSISTLEHMTDADLAEFCREVGRVLKPDGVAVLTVDLFLDLAPFTVRERNKYGRNLDLRQVLDEAVLEVTSGNESELLGFPAFDPDAIRAAEGRYLRGRYPSLAQCLVARPR
jgi:SAM-dependent methyltransferase